MLKLGIYRNWKNGKYYRVFHIAQHTETEEWFVIYQEDGDKGQFWARPLEMFCEKLQINGTIVPRFTYIGETREK